MVEEAMARGLEGVIATRTSLSYIDGESGRLLYRGYDIHDLAEGAGFLEGLYLLWNGDLPDRAQLAPFEARLASARRLEGPLVDLLRSLPTETPAMTALRTAVSAAGAHDPEAEDPSAEANERKAIRLVARIPVLIATFERLRRGLDPVEPTEELGHAANFLWTLRGEDPSEAAAGALDRTLLLYLDHGLNASTFTCRVIASTLSDLYAAVTGGLGALKGALHGGANARAMEMLREIGEVDRVEAYVDRALAEKRRIMGFGHRVYRAEDPRATHLREMSRLLCERSGESKWYEISWRLEEVMRERKGLYPNVDFYCATVYHALGLPIDLYTPLFAAGRVGGWTAHVLEQFADNRLIRPRAEYVGPESRTLPPLSER